MGSIITFYSYKGGVGRSMALANVAVLLARRGKKVLAVDWDLEAPGLPRYFSALTQVKEGAGLLSFLMRDGREGASESYKDYLSKVKDPQAEVTFDVFPSGQETDAEYSRNLERFKWHEFFRGGGGDLIENLRAEWKTHYDFVLIDSRTGLTDSGGICTIQLPDIIVAMFTANYQSVYGVRDVMRLAQQSRQRLSFDRMSLNIVPLPSRFGMRSEFKESNKWLDEFASAFAEFFSDWLPKGVKARQILDRMKVPQVDYFSFGERLAVLEDSSSNTEGMITPYNMVADVIESDLKNLQSALPPESWKASPQKQTIQKEALTSKEYLYDVFISYFHDPQSTGWLREFFLPLFQNHLNVLLGRPVNVFVDFQELRLGNVFNDQIEEAINRSRICVALLTPKYLTSGWCMREIQSFLRRSKIASLETGLILPVKLASGGQFPESVTRIQWADFEKFFLSSSVFRSSPQYIDFEFAVRDLAKTASRMIENAPPFYSESVQREVIPGEFRGINRFVVLMLGNRSFDHLFGYLKSNNPRVAGLNGDESNRKDPNSSASPEIKVSRASSFIFRFNPSSEFYDVQIQLYGPLQNTAVNFPPIANPPHQPAPMTGFVASATQAVDYSGDESQVMECFQSDQLPVLTTLANEFALFNFWYSSLPGPTWPNRFFIHAATSGGLSESPATAQILAGFSFQNGTIYERLDDAGKDWRIYHDGMPQTAGISDLRLEYINPLTKNFQDIEDFFEDIQNGDLGDYNFIEPRYDTGNNYLDGNSMHPLNDIRKGEELVKRIYESLRNSKYWADTMFIITFDEHGGFYDHQSPPATVSTGDDSSYANVANSFNFARLGVRVPAIVVSAYTAKGTVIGVDANEPSTIFDHTSVLATVERRFGLKPLTKRDASANTLEIALNATSPRLSVEDALVKLPDIAPDAAAAKAVDPVGIFAASPQAPLSANQKTMTALALACEMKVSDPAYHAALISNHQKIVEQKDAADYVQNVEQKIRARRKKSPAK